MQKQWQVNMHHKRNHLHNEDIEDSEDDDEGIPELMRRPVNEDDSDVDDDDVLENDYDVPICDISEVDSGCGFQYRDCFEWETLQGNSGHLFKEVKNLMLRRFISMYD